MRYIYSFLILLSALILIPNLASAEEYTVKVGTEENALVFQPVILKISPGDSVKFEWTLGMAHNVAEVSDSGSTTYESGFRSGDPQDGGNWTLHLI